MKPLLEFIHKYRLRVAPPPNTRAYRKVTNLKYIQYRLDQVERQVKNRITGESDEVEVDYMDEAPPEDKRRGQSLILQSMNSIDGKSGRKSKLSTVVKKKEVDVEYVSSSTLPQLAPGQNSTEVKDDRTEVDARKK